MAISSRRPRYRYWLAGKNMTKIAFRTAIDNTGTPLVRMSRNEHFNAENLIKMDTILDSDLATIAEILLNAKSLSKQVSRGVFQ